jgi:hypothetical protein
MSWIPCTEYGPVPTTDLHPVLLFAESLTVAMRSPRDEKIRPIREFITRLIKAPALLALLWPCLLIVCGAVAWHRWGRERLGEEFVSIDASAIKITQPPDFIRSPIVDTIYQNADLKSVSLLDRSAATRIASAFSVHPWVRKVSSVRKLPGGKVDVRLDYREPAAMVRVFKPGQTEEHPYYFPVDGEGVLLPSGDFARSETLEFIHIDVPGTYSTNPMGTRFGDPRVEAAATLAAVLHPLRRELAITAIEVYGDSRLNSQPQLEIRLADDSKVFWGSAPGTEPPGEATTEMKLQYLMDPNLPQDADLRMAGRNRMGR